MPSTYNDVGQNARRARDSSNFGTRKLAFYTFACDNDYNMVGATVTGGYSFRVNAINGAITFDADITERSVLDMNMDNQGYYDNDCVAVYLPFNIEMLSGSTNQIWINPNGGVNFADDDTDWYAQFNGNSGSSSVFIANNDGAVFETYSEETGSSGSRQFRVKVLGNTDYRYDNQVNLVYEFVLYEDHPEYVDFLVTHQPTESFEFNSSTAYWGVSNGNGWLDGLSNHTQSIAPFVPTSNPEYWKESNSLYYRIVQALQQANVELYWLGKPHRTDETFINNWDGLLPTETEAFTFAIADDASNPTKYLDGTNTYTVLGANQDGFQNALKLNTLDNFYRGQPIVFGMTDDGVVAGKTYYIREYFYAFDATYVRLSETVISENTDGSPDYPAGVGHPGPEFQLDQAPSANPYTATVYWYDVNWDGTAYDVTCGCCNMDPDYKSIAPINLLWYLGQSIPELNNYDHGYWTIYRSQSTYGIFPTIAVGA